MARPNWSAAARAAQSRHMKARWNALRNAERRTPNSTPNGPVRRTPNSTPNGPVIEQRIVLHVQGQTLELTLAEATQLRDALHGIPPSPPKPEHA